jgi:hypothetical protein
MVQNTQTGFRLPFYEYFTLLLPQNSIFVNNLKNKNGFNGNDGKLKAKNKIEETKKRLDTVLVDEQVLMVY